MRVLINSEYFQIVWQLHGVLCLNCECRKNVEMVTEQSVNTNGSLWHHVLSLIPSYRCCLRSLIRLFLFDLLFSFMTEWKHVFSPRGRPLGMSPYCFTSDKRSNLSCAIFSSFLRVDRLNTPLHLGMKRLNNLFIPFNHRKRGWLSQLIYYAVKYS